MMKFRFRPVYKWIFERLGWQIQGHFPRDVPKYLVVVAPHTSNWDFMVGLCVRSIERLQGHFLGKKELFKWPFGILFRYLGGYPVDRSKTNNFVDAVAEIFGKKEKFVVAIAPEGTRKRNDQWRSGFYHIAKKADVPVVRVAFDYANKRVVIDEPSKVTKSFEETLQEYHDFFRPYKGKIPEFGVL